MTDRLAIRSRKPGAAAGATAGATAGAPAAGGAAAEKPADWTAVSTFARSVTAVGDRSHAL
jgi:hypothetical protein